MNFYTCFTLTQWSSANETITTLTTYNVSSKGGPVLLPNFFDFGDLPDLVECLVTFKYITWWTVYYVGAETLVSET